MKRYINIIRSCTALLLVLMQTAAAQKEYRIGAGFSYAPSTLLNFTGAHHETGLDLQFRFKNSLGGDLHFSCPIKGNWSLIASAAYMQRGARILVPYADYLPRYRFTYADLRLGAAYHVASQKKIVPFVSASLSQHNLITAQLKNAYEEQIIRNDIQKMDLGILLACGADYTLSGKHLISAAFFLQQGMLNVYDGVYKANKLSAYNTQIGVRIGYALRIHKK